jgi:hypothetical protein
VKVHLGIAKNASFSLPQDLCLASLFLTHFFFALPKVKVMTLDVVKYMQVMKITKKKS